MIVTAMVPARGYFPHALCRHERAKLVYFLLVAYRQFAVIRGNVTIWKSVHELVEALVEP
jgi:hypothetical protein